MNNIFTYSPKELVTDAFVAWYVREFEEKPALKGRASSFFHKLGLCESENDVISNIKVATQERHTDLIIRYQVNDNETQALFENKIYTTTHSNQLERYKKEFPNFKYYKYMKLGYINFSERQQAKETGYDVVDVNQLNSALESVPQNNFIVDQYKGFLRDHFITNLDDITNNLIKNNRFGCFVDGQAQQYILSELHKNLNDRKIPHLSFKYAANLGGKPWTQLDIAKREEAYGDKAEVLFWRIDTRGKGYYLRLNQYSYIDDKSWCKKEKNLGLLRTKIQNLLESKGIALGKTSNRGKKESEVFILFFKDNNLSTITRALPDLSMKIYQLYSNTHNWE